MRSDGQSFFPSMQVALAQSKTASDAAPTEAAALGEASAPGPGWSPKPNWIGAPLLLGQMVQFQPRHADQGLQLTLAATKNGGGIADCLPAVVTPVAQQVTSAPTSVEPRRAAGQPESSEAEHVEPAAPHEFVAVVEVAVPDTNNKDWAVGEAAGDGSVKECGEVGVDSQRRVSKEPPDVETQGAVIAEPRGEVPSRPQGNEIRNWQAASPQAPSSASARAGHDQSEPHRAVATVVNRDAQLAHKADDRMNPRHTLDTAGATAAGAMDEEAPAVFGALIREKAVSRAQEQPVTSASPEAAPVARRVSPELPTRRHKSGSGAGENQVSAQQPHVGPGEGSVLEASTSWDRKEPGAFTPRIEDRPIVLSTRPETGTSRTSGSAAPWPTLSAEEQFGAGRPDRAVAAQKEVPAVKTATLIGELESAEGRGALREVSLKVQNESGATVHLKFTERRGEVHVVSRTSDAAMGRNLAEGLPELKRNIEEAGMRAEVWSSQGGRLTVEKEAKAETRSGTGSDDRSGQGTGRDGRSGSRSGSDANRWVDEIEDSLDEGGSGGKR